MNAVLTYVRDDIDIMSDDKDANREADSATPVAAAAPSEARRQKAMGAGDNERKVTASYDMICSMMSYVTVCSLIGDRVFRSV